jgi:iron complex transport system permease protein
VAENLSWDQMLALRLPRVILAFGVGAGLSIAGLVMQSLFSNPLSEPYTLGVSSGAALGAVIGMTLFPGFEFDGISPLAFFGALIFGLVLFFISKRFALRSVVILLMGVMFSFLGSSLMALWMTIADPMGVQAVLGWMLGDLSRARLTSALFVLFTVFVITFFMFFKSRSFDALLLGEFEAKTLGVDVGSLRSLMIILTSVLVGVCVSASGLIGFVGLIVPHLLRRLVGVSHQRLLPLGFFIGRHAFGFV